MALRYEVVLKRHHHSSRPNICIFYDEDRAVAVREMIRYEKQNGFSVHESDGHFTIADIVLVERESVVGGKIISTTNYRDVIKDRR